MFQLAACYVLSFYSSSHLLAPISTLTFELYINPEYANSANLVATKCLYISPHGKMADGSYERVLLVKPEVFVYQIPPRASNRAVR